MRKAFNNQGHYRIVDWQVDLLKEIGMRFENIKQVAWNKNYELAKIYYDHHGNLEIPTKFKTKNGYEYDENGFALGNWVSDIRRGKIKISSEQIEKLKEMGMRFESISNIAWNKNYELAKVYYEHHGNLEVPQRFKTINGYDYDDKGFALGSWISNIRREKIKITAEQIESLIDIGLQLENSKDGIWNKNYELAKAYYDHHGNLNITQKFKTKNGYDYDENGFALGSWISELRKAYKGQGNRMLTDNKIRKLEDIGMIWFTDTIDKKLQVEEITEKNMNRKQNEILHRLYSILNKFKSNQLPTSNELNKEFIGSDQDELIEILDYPEEKQNNMDSNSKKM